MSGRWPRPQKLVPADKKTGTFLSPETGHDFLPRNRSPYKVLNLGDRFLGRLLCPESGHVFVPRKRRRATEKPGSAGSENGQRRAPEDAAAFWLKTAVWTLAKRYVLVLSISLPAATKELRATSNLCRLAKKDEHCNNNECTR